MSDHDKKHNLEPTESVTEQELGRGTVLCVKELRDIKNNSTPTHDQIARKSILEERIRSSTIDYKYAIRYWMENQSKVTDGSYALIVKHIVKSAHKSGRLDFLQIWVA